MRNYKFLNAITRQKPSRELKKPHNRTFLIRYLVFVIPSNFLHKRITNKVLHFNILLTLRSFGIRILVFPILEWRMVMVQILILTKNVEYELPIFEKLRHLGHEVFLSRDILDYWEKNAVFPNCTEGFPIVILSETLSCINTEGILKTTKKERQQCLLKVDFKPTLEQEQEWEAKGFDGWIYEKSSLSELNNQFSQFSRLENRLSNGKNDSVTPFMENPYDSFDKVQNSLSTINQEIVQSLLKLPDRPVNREQLSEQVWGKCSESTLSQLSLRIKKINLILYSQLHMEHAIITEWGKGYRFKESFVETFL